MKIAITGATGNMGRRVLWHVLRTVEAEEVRLLVLPDDKRIKRLIRENRDYRGIIRVVYGNLADAQADAALVRDVDYVVNLASVIPPRSDKNPREAVECNQIGVDALVGEIEKLDRQPRLIHVSTIALYGNRNHRHPWAKVGDPLLVSPYDIYAATKMRGEFRVLESSVERWAVIRQTAMFHANMLADNMGDGLMFHTCFNAPLEWVTADDSGRLIANVVARDLQGGLDGVFWRKCFDLGAGKDNRNTGYDSLNDGFKLIGGSLKDYFRPFYSATRNFHGVWFYDGDILDGLFDYRRQTCADYWEEMKRSHRVYALAKYVPNGLISAFAVRRLFRNYNSPAYWKKHGESGKLTAYFGGEQAYDRLPSRWEECNLLSEGRTDSGEEIDYAALSDVKNAVLPDFGYVLPDSDGEITTETLRSVAEAHGGALLSEEYRGDMYAKLEWRTQDGERFFASPYTVLRAGHWYNPTYEKNVWEFDRLARKDKVYAALWYDSHGRDEDYVYSLDENFGAKIVREGE